MPGLHLWALDGAPLRTQADFFDAMKRLSEPDQILSAPLTARLEARPNLEDLEAMFEKAAPLGITLGDEGAGSELVVATVAPGSQAAGAGVAPGLRVGFVNGERVADQNAFFVAVSDAEGEFFFVRFTGTADDDDEEGDV